jgi:hypothetical protein
MARSSKGADRYLNRYRIDLLKFGFFTQYPFGCKLVSCVDVTLISDRFHSLAIDSGLLVLVESTVGPFRADESENGSLTPPPHDAVNGRAYIASVLPEAARNQLGCGRRFKGGRRTSAFLISRNSRSVR